MIDSPEQLWRLAGGYWASATVLAAVELDVFSAIGDSSRSASDVAKGLRGSEDGVKRLLNAVSALGLLEKDGGSYTNTDFSKSFLCKDSQHYMGYIMKHMYYLLPAWSELDKSVLTGKSVREQTEFTASEEERDAYLMGMFNVAMGVAPQATKKIALGGRKRLLDLGGGPGTWAIQFCLNNPQLTATIYDLPSTRPFAEKTIERFGLQERIEFCAGNYLEDDLPAGYDVAWLSQMLHVDGPTDCDAIVKKAVGALDPNGLIMVHEFLLNNDGAGPVFPALFSLNMLVQQPRGRSYTEHEVMDMLAKAGAKDVRRLEVELRNDAGIIAGIV